MKKAALLALLLCAALSLPGCGGSGQGAAVPPPSGQETQAETKDTPGAVENAAPETAGPVWRYELQTQTVKDEFIGEGNVLLARIDYKYPELIAVCESEAAGEAPADVQAVLDAFNNGVWDFVLAQPTVSDLARSAREMYENMDPDARSWFTPCFAETEVGDSYRTGDLLEVRTFGTVFYGGAHGLDGVKNFHFDLGTGEFVELDDLTDRPDKLRGVLAEDVVNQIYDNGEADWYFDGFDETVRGRETYNVSFGEKGVSVLFDEYEIAPYAAGIPEFEIPYEKFSRFLNARGERLLALPLETRILGDYYDAKEMWYWFEGATPLDYGDSRAETFTAANGSWEMQYLRFDEPGVSTLAQLRARLATRFDGALIEQRLAGDIPLFREFDGVLYAVPAGRGTDWTVESVDYKVELNAARDGGRILADIHRRDENETGDGWVSTGQVDQVEFPFTLGPDGAVFNAYPTIW